MKWEDPPARKASFPERRKAAYADEVAELKASPGKWAVLRESAYRNPLAQLGYRITRGIYRAFRPVGAFETTVRQDKETGTFKLYVRYTGDENVPV